MKIKSFTNFGVKIAFRFFPYWFVWLPKTGNWKYKGGFVHWLWFMINIDWWKDVEKVTITVEKELI